MRTEYRFTCSLRNGLHARPASMLSEAVRPFASVVRLSRPGADPADVRSVLSLVGLDVKFGDECRIEIEGDDAEACRVALVELIEQRLAQEDESAAQAIAWAEAATVLLPVSLEALHPRVIGGVGVSPGVGEGESVLVRGLALTAEQAAAKPRSADEELAKVRLATSGLRDELSRRSASVSGLERELLGAHASIATDPALLGDVERAIAEGATAIQAVVAAAGRFCGQLGTASSVYIRDRVVDVQDVAMQLLVKLGGRNCATCGVTLTRPSIVLADVLTPSQLMALDRSLLRGLLLGHVGATSHTVILARSMGIPAIIDSPVSEVGEGRQIILDGARGVAFANPSEAVARWYTRFKEAEQARLERLAPMTLGPARTADGAGLEIGCNASGADEVGRAVRNGADGVGLLRTELLFLDRDTPPSEHEQFEAYAGVVRAAGGRPVIIRTFDIGGDKPARYMRLLAEDNPFLGERGFRLYVTHPQLIRDQLRAVLRASALGPVKIMAPMIATPAEAGQFRSMVEDIRRELASESIDTGPPIPIGVMIEVPGLALVMDQLCRHADFVSIGTNDLAQYTFAVDRGNRRIASLHDVRHPAFLRLLRLIVDGAKRAGRWVGVCGEMGGDPVNIPLMVGLGVDEVSGPPADAGRLKIAVRAADRERCRTLLEQACDCADGKAVGGLLSSGLWRAAISAPISGEAFIEVGVTATTKAEAIRAGIDRLYAMGRTDRPDDVERAVWTREAEYSTSMVPGFAVPHCKAAAVISPTLVILKLASPVEWNEGGNQVSVVLLLVVPASDAAGSHMKVLARLSRKLVHDDFRAAIEAAPTPEAVLAAVQPVLDS